MTSSHLDLHMKFVLSSHFHTENVGNYEESFKRNLGSESLLNLKRGFNKLYNEGGLLYSPPFR